MAVVTLKELLNMKKPSFAVPLFVAVCIAGCSAAAEQQKLSTVVDRPNNLDRSRNRNVPVTFHLPDREGVQPLVLVSHGAAGSRDGLFALAREISRQGYVVMCLEHVTSNLGNVRLRMRTNRIRFKDAIIDSAKDMSVRKNRPLDVRFAIDLAERLNRDDERLKGRIDLSKIAMIGHSYGAFTTMVCCGAKPVRIDEDLAEPRIKMGIALSPQSGSGVFFDKESFSKMTCPFIGISGTGDKTFDTASAEKRMDSFNLMTGGDKHYLWFHDAGHFSFSDPTGSDRRIILPPDQDVTNSLKVLVPAMLNTYLRHGPKLDESSRGELVQRSLGGKVRQIDWTTK